MIERELNIVKYSTRRTICMKIGEQLGKHWGKVTYDDIAKVKLSPADLEAAQYIFNVMYPQDMEVVELYVPGDPGAEADDKFNELLSDNYDTVEELLVHEMIDSEKKLSEADLKKISVVQDIPMEVLYKAKPVAEQMLYKRLKDIQEYREDINF